MVPRYAHGPDEDAGMDLHSVEAVTLAPGETKLVATGLAIELPPGYEAQIRPRSGLALKYSITLPNSPATIDPGYRGEIKVILHNLGREPFQVHPASASRRWSSRATKPSNGKKAIWQIPAAAKADSDLPAGNRKPFSLFQIGLRPGPVVMHDLPRSPTRAYTSVQFQ